MRNLLTWMVLLLAGQPLLAQTVQTQTEPLPALIIVIDDLGNNNRLGQRTVNLPGPVNLALLPHTLLWRPGRPGEGDGGGRENLGDWGKKGL